MGVISVLDYTFPVFRTMCFVMCLNYIVKYIFILVLYTGEAKSRPREAEDILLLRLDGNAVEQEYNVPSSSTILILWLCVTGILFICFLLILIYTIKTRCVENYIRSRRDMIGSSNRSWAPKYGEKQLVPPFFYPEPPSTKVEEAHINYEDNRRRCSDGIENPTYVHDTSNHKGLTKEISQTSTIVDDFDSDDDTIYPPAPLPRPVLIRKQKRSNNLMKNPSENETEL